RRGAGMGAGQQRYRDQAEHRRGHAQGHAIDQRVSPFAMATQDLVILGTDTDAGKTTFAALWLSAFGADYEYWKPLETGEPDSQRVRGLVPSAVVHPSLQHFDEPVAPLLAARWQGAFILPAEMLAAEKPSVKIAGR